MYVKLMTFTPQPEKVVAAAARLCYSAQGAESIMSDMPETAAADLIRRLREMGHFSPFEHASFTFAVEGVSRALSHQLVRHRIASYSQKSQRYVRESDFSFVVPPSIAANQKAESIYTRAVEDLCRAYGELTRLVDREDARYLLPNSCHTHLLCTFNARSLLNFFQLRCCRRAQWEIRKLAELMLQEVKIAAPTIFKKAGPTCISQGICREGKMSCGRIKEPEKKEE